jgi:hypothetical protein
MAKLWKRAKVGTVVVLSILAFAQAVQAVNFAGGTGDPNDPYLVATRDQLVAIGSNSALAGKCFKLVADIDLAGIGFYAPIIPTFSGTFDGNGHAIRNLYLAGFANVGLFGTVQSDGRILNLSLPNADVLSTQYAGTLAGQNSGMIRHCDSTGSAICLASYSYGAGGLVGYNTGTVTDSRSAADADGYYYVGGLIGYNSGTVSDSETSGSVFGHEYAGALIGYNTGIISTSCSDGNATGYYNTGGLVGYNSGGVTACYATGSAAGYSSVAGLVGYNTGRISSCYSLATVTLTSTSGYSLGYLVGSNGGSVTACYYVVVQAISGASSSTAGTILTTQQMKQRTNLVGWDFWGTTTDGTADTWFMPSNAFPVLTRQTDITGMVAVPDVGGLPFTEASAALTAAGLVAGTVTQDYHRTLPAGSVIWAYPHLFAQRGGTIDLVLSKGAAYDWAENPGNGTAAKPYQIQSAGQLELLGDHPEMWSKSFVLMADLDMSGRTYAAALIAPDVNSVAGFQGVTFTGSFNGNAHAILNLVISRDSSTRGTYFGLFGMVDNIGLINSLSLKNATVTTGTSTTATYAGTLAGLSGGTIVACSSTGAILTDSNANAGGLVGYNHGSMANCQTDVVIARSSSTSSGGGATR